MSDDTPTERFDQQPASPVGPTTTPSDRAKRGRLVPILVAAGAVLLVGVIVLAVIFLTRPATSASAPTSASPTPSETTSATPPPPAPAPTPGTPADAPTSAPAPPAGSGLAITSFLVNGSAGPVVYCDTSAPSPAPIDLSIMWTSQNVSNVYFGVSTTDAQAGGSFSNLPASGSNENFPSGQQDVTFPCPAHSQEYTLTVVSGSGGKVSRYVTVTNKGDQS